MSPKFGEIIEEIEGNNKTGVEFETLYDTEEKNHQLALGSKSHSC